jgi:hypothetical protein
MAKGWWGGSVDVSRCADVTVTFRRRQEAKGGIARPPPPPHRAQQVALLLMIQPDCLRTRGRRVAIVATGTTLFTRLQRQSAPVAVRILRSPRRTGVLPLWVDWRWWAGARLQLVSNASTFRFCARGRELARAPLSPAERAKQICHLACAPGCPSTSVRRRSPAARGWLALCAPLRLHLDMLPLSIPVFPPDLHILPLLPCSPRRPPARQRPVCRSQTKHGSDSDAAAAMLTTPHARRV